MIRVKVVRFILVIVALFFVPLSMAQPRVTNPPEIEHLSGDVYRVYNGGVHYTLFVVTPDGIILTDPISTEFSTWLKQELTTRFDLPVKYVLYSHNHQDHASGGDVFAETAIFVGHENMPANVIAERLKDEKYHAVRLPDLTYSDRMTLKFGGKTIEILHVDPRHTDDSVIMFFEEDQIAYGVDWLNIRRLPHTDNGVAAVDSWIETIEQMEAYDFTIAAPGHGPTGSRSDLQEYKAYLQFLLDGVSDGIAQSRSVEQLQESMNLEPYKDWQEYHLGKRNIADVYKYLMADN